ASHGLSPQRFRSWASRARRVAATWPIAKYVANHINASAGTRNIVVAFAACQWFLAPSLYSQAEPLGAPEAGRPAVLPMVRFLLHLRPGHHKSLRATQWQLAGLCLSMGPPQRS